MKRIPKDIIFPMDTIGRIKISMMIYLTVFIVFDVIQEKKKK